MDCRDIDLAIGNPEHIAGAREHLDRCPRCRSLVDFLSGPDRLGLPSDALMAELERKFAGSLKPVKPLRPAGYFAAIWSVVFLALVVVGSIELRPLALPKMGVAVSVMALGLLVLCAAALILSLSRQMTPGSRYRLSPALLPAAAVTVLALLFYLLFPLEVSTNFWHAGRKCFTVGIVFGSVAAALFWFSLRRGSYSEPHLAGATAGLLAGLAGTTVLTVHCPLLEVSHVVCWHLGAAAVASLAGAAIAGLSAQGLAHLRH